VESALAMNEIAWITDKRTSEQTGPTRSDPFFQFSSRISHKTVFNVVIVYNMPKTYRMGTS